MDHSGRLLVKLHGRRLNQAQLEELDAESVFFVFMILLKKAALGQGAGQTVGRSLGYGQHFGHLGHPQLQTMLGEKVQQVHGLGNGK